VVAVLVVAFLVLIAVTVGWLATHGPEDPTPPPGFPGAAAAPTEHRGARL
jgi:hypothetical protein